MRNLIRTDRREEVRQLKQAEKGRKNKAESQWGSHTPVTLALRRLRQEELKFGASLGYIVSLKPA